MALIHGGDTEGYFEAYGKAPLDFSANCNPLGIPVGVAKAIAAAATQADKYPDPLCRQLCAAISEKLGLPPSYVLCGNGAADLIFRLALAKRPKTALVTAPTFAEYELALKTTGCAVGHYFLEESAGFRLDASIIDRITPALDILFICNPNNPTGLTVAPALLQELLDTTHQTGTLLVVDECFNGFLDAPEDRSLKRRLKDYDNLLILDAFTKLYGMAGVRLGYCLSSNANLLDAIRDAGQPWSVSSLAQAAGIAALQEFNYVNTARALIQTERADLTAALTALGLRVFGGEANYIFFHAPIPTLGALLRQRGILIRDCGNYAGLAAGFWRVAVRTHSENEQLIGALGDVLKEAKK
ncbi:aminotransferase class I/II-fold pyridoxal phosphate-dependent enzyme [Oscillospiraceae bacterium CM]|nr:aminotransferase class I/II-fold pyridoxal phosphate-dependent enzyme [Oscillospiraceae bacterium CM]